MKKYTIIKEDDNSPFTVQLISSNSKMHVELTEEEWDKIIFELENSLLPKPILNKLKELL